MHYLKLLALGFIVVVSAMEVASAQDRRRSAAPRVENPSGENVRERSSTPAESHRREKFEKFGLRCVEITLIEHTARNFGMASDNDTLFQCLQENGRESAFGIMRLNEEVSKNTEQASNGNNPKIELLQKPSIREMYDLKRSIVMMQIVTTFMAEQNSGRNRNCFLTVTGRYNENLVAKTNNVQFRCIIR